VQAKFLPLLSAEHFDRPPSSKSIENKPHGSIALILVLVSLNLDLSASEKKMEWDSVRINILNKMFIG
jgi:hypothetical protein